LAVIIYWDCAVLILVFEFVSMPFDSEGVIGYLLRHLAFLQLRITEDEILKEDESLRGYEILTENEILKEDE
jgi:hypothetical protein